MPTLSCRPDHLAPLMLRLAAGEGAAFAPLYRSLWPALRGYCAKRLAGDPDAAEDAAQEALVKVYLRASQFDPQRGSVRTWALRIAGFECLTARRRAQRRRVVPGEIDLDAVLADGPSPEEVTIRRGLVRAVGEALQDLPERDVDALRGVSDPDVAAATVRKRRQRATRRLREAWDRRHGLAPLLVLLAACWPLVGSC